MLDNLNSVCPLNPLPLNNAATSVNLSASGGELLGAQNFSAQDFSHHYCEPNNDIQENLNNIQKGFEQKMSIGYSIGNTCNTLALSLIPTNKNALQSNLAPHEKAAQIEYKSKKEIEKDMAFKASELSFYFSGIITIGLSSLSRFLYNKTKKPSRKTFRQTQAFKDLCEKTNLKNVTLSDESLETLVDALRNYSYHYPRIHYPGYAPYFYEHTNIPVTLENFKPYLEHMMIEHQREEYTFAPMSDLPRNAQAPTPKPKTLYVKTTNGAAQYIVLSDDGKSIIRDKVNHSDLNCVPTPIMTNEIAETLMIEGRDVTDPKFKKAMLNITTNRGHTPPSKKFKDISYILAKLLPGDKTDFEKNLISEYEEPIAKKFVSDGTKSLTWLCATTINKNPGFLNKEEKAFLQKDSPIRDLLRMNKQRAL